MSKVRNTAKAEIGELKTKLLCHRTFARLPPPNLPQKRDETAGYHIFNAGVRGGQLQWARSALLILKVQVPKTSSDTAPSFYFLFFRIWLSVSHASPRPNLCISLTKTPSPWPGDVDGSEH
jgi:hypothetical protein